MASEYWEDVRRLQDDWGFLPMPCPPKQVDESGKVKHDGKHPDVYWTDYREAPPSPGETESWFPSGTTVWSLMGPITGWVALDTDNAAGEMLWRERLGPLLDQTTCVRTRRGFHYFFTVPKGSVFPRWTWLDDREAKQLDAHFDVIGHGYGIVLPPSAFPDGPADDGRTHYEWVRGPEFAQDAPAILHKPKKEPSRATNSSGRSTLASLLSDRPTEGGRNNWHNRVSGHFAKLIPYEDGFLALAAALNDSLQLPLDEAELLKTWEQAWKSENEKGVLGSEASGFLSSDGKRVFTVVRTKDGEDKQSDVPYPWINGDVRVTGVNEDDKGGRAYEVLITREDGTIVSDIVKPGVLAARAETWLAGFGLSVMVPPTGKTDVSGKTPTGARLIRFFESQKPPRFRTVPCLGWNAESGTFLTDRGVILGEPGELALSPFNGYRPDPMITENELVSVQYGFSATENEAIEVLREVMHFHHEDFTAVFASFCVASVLKGNLEPFTNVWPYPAVAAPSGSGKSSGFIPMIQQLIGRKGKAGTFTKAAARDELGAHRCLPAWIDDPDDLGAVKELLRLCASDGSAKRKGGVDFTKNIVTNLVQTPIITAEAINLGDQKAYADRMISLTLESPVNRRSRHDATLPQINDIDDLRAKYGGDLSCLSGHVVSRILQERFSCTPERFREYRAAHPGRHADKMAILKMGAHVLGTILGSGYGWVEARVDQWIAAQEYDPNANRFTQKLVPDALTLLGSHFKPEHWEGQAPTPVLVRADKNGVLALWVSTRNLAIWWSLHTKGRIEERTDTEEAINQQADALGMKGARAGELNIDFVKANYQTVTGSKTNAVYRRLPDSVGQRIIARLGIEDPAGGSGAPAGGQRSARRGGSYPTGGSVPTPQSSVPTPQSDYPKRLSTETVTKMRALRDPQQEP